jgi:hypothetical protein
MDENKFWLFDPDPEGEIYENLSWDLPGYVLPRKTAQSLKRRGIKDRNQP